MTGRDWDPEEWQAHCQDLLLAHYGVRVQIIPDRDSGDGGLEAFVADESTAFQCYAPEDPFNVSTQTEAQKGKIRSDTKKLLDQPDRTTRLIGVGNAIKEWVLLTPAFESKDLVEYANKRSATVFRLAELHPWCGTPFRISVHDDSLFGSARAMLAATGSRLAVTASAPDLNVLRETGTIPVGIEAVLDLKFISDPRLAANADLLKRVKDETLRDYFLGEQELSRLASEAPAVHRAATICSEIVLNGLAQSIGESDSRPLVVVKEIRTQLQAMLTSNAPGLRLDLSTLLARYFVASWWIQCPLQFDVDTSE